MTFQEAEIPLEASAADPEPQRISAGLASTGASSICNIYGRFTGSETQSRIPNVQERVMPPTASQASQENQQFETPQ